MAMPYQVLMPMFASDIFHGGPHTLGFLMSAVGLGAMTGAVYLASRRTVVGLVKRVCLAAAVFGAGLAAFSFSTATWMACLFLTATGLGMMVLITGCNTFLQTVVDDDKRGRVMSFYTMAFMGTVPFGNILAGTLAGTVGVRATVLLGGICCLLGAGLFAWKLPEIRRYTRPVYVKKRILPPDPAEA